MWAQSMQLDAGSMRSDDPPASMLNRADILADIGGYLQTVQSSSGEDQMRIVNYYGITGVGKSFVILNIFHAYHRDYPIIWLDFDTEQASRSDSIHHWADVRFALRQIPTLQFMPDTIKLSDYDKVALDAKKVLFRAVNLDLYDQKPLIVLLDHLDGVDYWEWLQASVLQPFLGKQRTLVVCMSQTPLAWHSYHLLDRCIVRKVHPFSIEETRAFLRQFDLELFTQLAQDVTQGYPLRLFYLLQLLEQEGRFNEHVEPVSLAQLREQLSPETFDIVSTIGLMRSFDVDIAHHVLGECAVDWRERANPRALLRGQIFSELRPYFAPYRRGQPYRLMPELRRTIERSLQERDLSLYLAICTQLASSYSQRFMRDPHYYIGAFLDWCYFSSEVLRYSTLGREAWLAEAYRLLARAQSIGMRLAFSLYKDGELTHKLQELNLFRPLIDMLRVHASLKAPGMVLDDTEFSTYNQWVIERIAQQTSLRRLQDTLNLMNLLATIESLGTDFEPGELYDQLKQIDESLNPLNLKLALSLLYNSGLVEDSGRPHRLTLPSAVRTLVSAP